MKNEIETESVDENGCIIVLKILEECHETLRFNGFFACDDYVNSGFIFVEICLTNLIDQLEHQVKMLKRGKQL